MIYIGKENSNYFDFIDIKAPKPQTKAAFLTYDINPENDNAKSIVDAFFL